MSRRLQALTDSQVAELINEASSDDSDAETGYLDSQGSEESDDGDVLHAYVGDEAPNEAPDDAPEDEHRSRGRDLTKSQRKLEEAVLEAHDPPTAAPYVAYGARQAVTATWDTNFATNRRRTDRANLLTERAGVRGDARNVSNEVDAFKLFISDDMITEIAQRTTEKLEEEKVRLQTTWSESTRQQKKHLYSPVDHDEMAAFLGLNIMRGFYSDLTMQQLFDTATGPSVFKATMGGGRFSTILKNLTFDDRNSRTERKKGDKFCHIRDLFNLLDENLRRHFAPSECVTVDESLVRFRGRCPFRMYLPSKPGKYGILFRTVADATFRYMWKIWPYSGRPEAPERSPPNVQLDGVPEMVKFLVQELSGTGRNVTLDRFFTSVPLAEELAADRLTMVGTVNKTRKLIPKVLKEPHGRSPGSNLFCCRNSVTLVSHCQKPGKVVLLMSTQHQEPLIDTRSGKPEIMLYYNATKGGVDVVDAMVESYIGRGPLQRWPTAVLFFVMGVAQVNSSTILLLNRGHDAADVRKGVRREMMFTLGRGLITPRLQQRVANPTGLNSDVTAALACATGGQISTVNRQQPAGSQVRGRCVTCLSELKGRGSWRDQKNKMSKQPACHLCNTYVCRKHSKTIRVCDPECPRSE